MAPRRVPPSAAEVVGTPADRLGEGPHWDAERGVLTRVDLYEGLVHTLDPASGEQTTLDVGRPVGFAVPRASGGLVFAVGHEVRVRDPDGQTRVIAELDRDIESNRINDGKCDSAGRLWTGTLARNRERGAASLYRVSPAGDVHRAHGDVIIGNGMDWSPDGGTFYFIDSATKGVDAYDFDPGAGTLSGRRTLIAVDAHDGMPDGMTVDADGGLWVALFRGAAVHRYTPSGQLDTVVELPLTCPTSVAFGGPELRDLYVTSSSHRLSEREASRDRLAGQLLRLQPGQQGLAPTAFGG